MKQRRNVQVPDAQAQPASVGDGGGGAPSEEAGTRWTAPRMSATFQKNNQSEEEVNSLNTGFHDKLFFTKIVFPWEELALAQYHRDPQRAVQKLRELRGDQAARCPEQGQPLSTVAGGHLTSSHSSSLPCTRARGETRGTPGGAVGVGRSQESDPGPRQRRERWVGPGARGCEGGRPRGAHPCDRQRRARPERPRGGRGQARREGVPGAVKAPRAAGLGAREGRAPPRPMNRPCPFARRQGPQP